jgi:hypothetical protein
MLLIYVVQKMSRKKQSTLLIQAWKVARALKRPKGITRVLKKL